MSRSQINSELDKEKTEENREEEKLFDIFSPLIDRTDEHITNLQQLFGRIKKDRKVIHEEEAKEEEGEELRSFQELINDNSIQNVPK